MNIHDVYDRLSTPFRRRRMREFERRFILTSDTTILDVGGTPEIWELIDSKPAVTLLNLTWPPSPLPSHIQGMVGDGTQLPFEDCAFDIVFSNSVVEHLYTWENQRKFAREVRRVGKAHWIQTPNRNFPIEPHYLTPAIQFLPKSWQRRLIRNFTVRGWIDRPDDTECRQMVDEIRLLHEKEMTALFPESCITRESLLGLTKSFTAIHTDGMKNELARSGT